MPTNQSESPAIPDISQSDCLAQWGPGKSKRQAQWGPDQSNGQDKRFSQPEYRQHSSSNLFTQKKTKVSVNSDYHSSGGDNEFSSGQTESSSQSESSSDSTEEEEEKMRKMRKMRKKTRKKMRKKTRKKKRKKKNLKK